MPGISGMENNMVVFEYDKENPENLPEIIDNIRLIKAGDFDICLLASASREMICNKGIHVWIDFNEPENASLLILLSFIISGHPDWKKSFIKVFSTCKPGQYEETRRELEGLITSGRLPITEKNVEIIEVTHGSSVKSLINEKSSTAAMVMTGFRPEALRQNGRPSWEVMMQPALSCSSTRSTRKRLYKLKRLLPAGWQPLNIILNAVGQFSPLFLSKGSISGSRPRKLRYIFSASMIPIFSSTFFLNEVAVA